MTSHLSEWLSSRNPQTINAGVDVKKREPSYTVGGNLYSHYGEQYGGSFKKKKAKPKLNIVLPYDPAIPLLLHTLKKP